MYAAQLITGRNEVVAKVIFLHLSVILFTGGRGSASVHAGIPPPREQTTPPDQTPLGADTPPRADTPPEQTPRPPGKQTPTYGLRAAGTHRTGMHSCLMLYLTCKQFWESIVS